MSTVMDSFMGYRVVMVPPRFTAREVECRSRAHPHIVWLARWVPWIDPEIRWTCTEWDEVDEVVVMNGALYVSPRQLEAIRQAA